MSFIHLNKCIKQTNKQTDIYLDVSLMTFTDYKRWNDFFFNEWYSYDMRCNYIA